VVAHLEAENAHTRAVLADTEGLQEALYLEMRGRIQEEDTGAPVRWAAGRARASRGLGRGLGGCLGRWRARGLGGLLL
jgi:hypothetical protein